MNKIKSILPEQFITIFHTNFFNPERVLQKSKHQKYVQTLVLVLKFEPNSAPAKSWFLHSNERIKNYIIRT